MSTPVRARLAPGVKLAYGLPAFVLAVVGIPVYVYVPKFYSDVVGVEIALTGTILLGVRLFDAVSDPLISLVSDRTRSPWGRRRPYIALGGLGVALSMYFLFVPPVGGSAAAHTVWFGVWIFLLFLCWTAVTVPYEALGPELTPDYDERTGLFALRDGRPVRAQAVGQRADRLLGHAHPANRRLQAGCQQGILQILFVPDDVARMDRVHPHGTHARFVDHAVFAAPPVCFHFVCSPEKRFQFVNQECDSTFSSPQAYFYQT